MGTVTEMQVMCGDDLSQATGYLRKGSKRAKKPYSFPCGSEPRAGAEQSRKDGDQSPWLHEILKMRKARGPPPSTSLGTPTQRFTRSTTPVPADAF
ncbi:hypothetical protein VTN02DRAFT_3350 [Thermoascus thermophilus]